MILQSTLYFKGLLHPKMKINHFPPCRSKPIKSLVRLQNTIWDIWDENREACDCPIDCQTINTVKTQKSMKDIFRIVHLPLMVQP